MRNKTSKIYSRNIRRSEPAGHQTSSESYESSLVFIQK